MCGCHCHHEVIKFIWWEDSANKEDILIGYLSAQEKNKIRGDSLINYVACLGEHTHATILNQYYVITQYKIIIRIIIIIIMVYKFLKLFYFRQEIWGSPLLLHHLTASL